MTDQFKRQATEYRSIARDLASRAGPACTREYSDLVAGWNRLAEAWEKLLAIESAAQKNIAAIVQVCGEAGIGSRGQTVLCMVKDMKEQLGHQIDRADRAEAELRKIKRAMERCEHDVVDGDWCPECNRAHKDAAKEAGL